MWQRLEATTAPRRRVRSGALLTVAIGVVVVGLGTTTAGADGSWSRVPASGIGGGTVRVASSAATLCQWVQPAAPSEPPPTSGDPTTTAPTATVATGSPAGPTVAAGAGDTLYDGTEVRVRLWLDGVDTPLGTLTVAPGGAWAGDVTLPDADLAPGDYELFVKCVIDRPELDGVRTYDFDPLGFTVTEGPPPTTLEIPTELVPPITAVNPVQVQGAQLDRPVTVTKPAVRTTTVAAATLPNTGDGTLETALAGLGALLVGAVALWWGAKHGRRHPEADLLD